MKFGRKPRRYDPRVPHLSSLLAGRRRLLAPPPPSVDYISPLACSSFGMMGNDRLGDCTCAALGHARQIWTGNANPPMQTVSDASVIALYQGACGYNPSDPNSDQGGDEQSVLTYAMLKGLPLDGGGADQLIAFVEVDPSNIADVKATIADCGVCYIGFNVPDYAMSTVGQLWDVQAGSNPKIVGGHAVILSAYDDVGPTCITWGARQKMTWGFFEHFTDEAYALASHDWIASTGKCPAGLSITDLESAMQALRSAQQ